LSGVVVVPDRGGQGQDALQHPDRDLDRCPAAEVFQVELALEGVVDRLDQLAQRPEQPPARPLGSPLLAGRTSRMSSAARPSPNWWP